MDIGTSCFRVGSHAVIHLMSPLCEIVIFWPIACSTASWYAWGSSPPIWSA